MFCGCVIFYCWVLYLVSVEVTQSMTIGLIEVIDAIVDDDLVCADSVVCVSGGYRKATEEDLKECRQIYRATESIRRGKPTKLVIL